MRTRLTTLCAALFLGIRALAQTGDFVLANPDGSIFRPANFWTNNAAAISNALNLSLLVPNSRLISTSGSLTGGGDLTANRTLSLVGDNASPGTWYFYGTDGSGSKGFYALPSGGIGDAPNNGTAYLRRNAAWTAADFSLLAGVATDGQIPAAIARDAEVAAAYPPNARTITGANSISGGGDLTANRTLSLVGDTASPAANRYYGTDGTGTRGFFDLPTGSIAEAPINGLAYVRRNAAWTSNDFSLITGTASDAQIPAAVARDAEVAAAYPPNARTITGANSVTGGGDLTANRTLSLVNDSTSPGASRYYGTDGSGTKGFFPLPSGNSIGTNNGAVGNPVVLQPNGGLATTNEMTVSNLVVSGNFDIGTNNIPQARGGTGGTNAASALVALGAQASDSDLAAEAALATTGIKVRTGSGTVATRAIAAGSSAISVSNGDGVAGDPTINVVETNLLTTQINGGAPNGAGSSVEWSRLKGVPPGVADGVDDTSSFSWDIDVSFSITNASTEFYPVYTNAVADGVARSFFLRMQESGATNSADFNFGGRVVNRGGAASSTNWVEHYYVTESNSWCYVTNVGTNAVVYVRGPVNGPQNGRVWGTLSSVNNGGTLAGGGPPPMTNSVYAFWAMTGTGSASESDLMGTNTLYVSAGDTIPTTNNLPVTPTRLFNDGEDDYMTAYQVPMASTDSFTVAGWVRADSAAATRYIAARTNAFSLRMASTDSTLRWVVSNASTNKEVVGQNIGSGTNYFVGCTYNITNSAITLMICSVGGTNIYSGTFAPGVETGTADFFVSASFSNLGLNWAGSLDELFLAKRAFSTNDFLKLYNSGTGVAWPWTGL